MPDVAEAKLTYISSLPRDSFINYSNDASTNKVIQAMVDKLPDHIMYAIQTNDYHIHVSNDGKDYGQSMGGVGICMIGGDYICVKKSLIGQQFGKEAVYHEIGHAYDYCVSSPYSADHNNEFSKIYEAEKNKIRLFKNSSYSHTRSSLSEYFAEAFAVYILDAKLLKAHAPKTYQYMAKITKQSTTLKYANSKERYMKLAGNSIYIQPQTSSSAAVRSRQSNYCIAVKYLPSQLLKDLLADGWRTKYTDSIKTTAKIDKNKKEIYINDVLIRKKNPKHANLMVQKTIAKQCIRAYLIDHPIKGVDQKKLSDKMVSWLFHAKLDSSYAKQINKLCKNCGSTTAKIKKIYTPSKNVTSKVSVVKKYYDSKTKECTKAKLKLTYDMGQGNLAGLYADDYARYISVESDYTNDRDYNYYNPKQPTHKGQIEFTFNAKNVLTYEYSIISTLGGRYDGTFKTDFVKLNENKDNTEEEIEKDENADVTPIVTFEGYPSTMVEAGKVVEGTIQINFFQNKSTSSDQQTDDPSNDNDSSGSNSQVEDPVNKDLVAA